MSAALIDILVYVPCGIAVLIGAIGRLQWPFVGFLAMLAMIPAQEATVLVGGRTLVWLLGIGVLGAWSLRTLVKGRLVRVAKGPAVAIGIWLLWCASSIFWAHDQAVSIGRTITLAQLIAFFFLIQLMVTTDRRLRIVSLTYFVATVVVASLTIWVGISADLRRAFLVEGQNPNVLARSLGIGLLMAPYVLRQLKQNRWRWLVIPGAAVLAVTVMLTGSRGAWVGLIAAAGFTWLLVRSKFVRLRTLAIASVALVVGITALYSGGVIDDYMIRRILTITDIQATGGLSGRTKIWQVGWEMVEDNPLVGVGLGNFPARFDEYIDEAGQTGLVSSGRDPHSVFLSIQAEVGIVGMFLSLCVVFVIFKRLLRVRDDPRAILGILLLTFMLVTGVPGTIQYKQFFWLAFGLAAVIPGVIARDKT